MGFRRKKEDVKTEHKWKQFVSNHAVLIQEVGLPLWISDEHDYWQDVVYYGYPEQYYERTPSSIPDFDLTGAKPSELVGFVRLLNLYFEDGFAYYNPEFLKWQDRKAYNQIVARFAPAET
ncbi:MAG: hypothetical protein ACRYFS_09915 [Janthinobacterium lividum]